MKEKLGGYEFYSKVLGNPTKVVAPMVDQSELAWRMLSRKYGAELCYSPMFHSSVFLKDPQYRNDALASCKEDRPLIIQFCGNDPDIIIRASKLAEKHCDAIDLNLGCPQMIAKRGYYGAFLEKDWKLIEEIIKRCHEELDVPITCKIRVFDDIKKSVEYARMIERAGCQLLTVHGRTKEMKGPNTGIASWKHIKAIKESLQIPVIANGNIQYKQDYLRCMEETNVDGVMIAEGSLRNPALFQGVNPIVWDITEEYLDLVDIYPCPLSYVRGHVFKMCHHALQRHHVAREAVATSKSLSDIRTAVSLLKQICTEQCHQSSDDVTHTDDVALPLPHWMCQPYIRPPPPETSIPNEKIKDENAKISKKKMKKLIKRKHAPNVEGMTLEESARKLLAFEIERSKMKITYSKCVLCGNPAGEKCVFKSCRLCCKKRSKEVETINCYPHKQARKMKSANKNKV